MEDVLKTSFHVIKLKSKHVDALLQPDAQVKSFFNPKSLKLSSLRGQLSALPDMTTETLTGYRDCGGHAVLFYRPGYGYDSPYSELSEGAAAVTEYMGHYPAAFNLLQSKASELLGTTSSFLGAGPLLYALAETGGMPLQGTAASSLATQVIRGSQPSEPSMFETKRKRESSGVASTVVTAPAPVSLPMHVDCSLLSIVVLPKGDHRLRVRDISTGCIVDPLAKSDKDSVHVVVMAGHLLAVALGLPELACQHYVVAAPEGYDKDRVSLVFRCVPPPGAELNLRSNLARMHGLLVPKALVTVRDVTAAFRASSESVTTSSSSAAGGAVGAAMAAFDASDSLISFTSTSGVLAATSPDAGTASQHPSKRRKVVLDEDEGESELVFEPISKSHTGAAAAAPAAVGSSGAPKSRLAAAATMTGGSTASDAADATAGAAPPSAAAAASPAAGAAAAAVGSPPVASVAAGAAAAAGSAPAAAGTFKVYVCSTEDDCVVNINTYTVSPTDTFADVKQQIADSAGIPMDEQKLYSGEDQCDDDARLNDYDIQVRSVCMLSASTSRIYLYYSAHHRNAANLCTLLTHPQESPVLDLVLRDTMRIFVSTPSTGLFFSLDVKHSHTVLSVKNLISQKMGIPTGDQHLTGFSNYPISNNQPTNNALTMKDGGVREYSTLIMTLSPPAPGHIRFFVKTLRATETLMVAFEMLLSVTHDDVLEVINEWKAQ